MQGADGLGAVTPTVNHGVDDPGHNKPGSLDAGDALGNNDRTDSKEALDGIAGNAFYSDAGSSSASPTTVESSGTEDSYPPSATPEPTDYFNNNDGGNDDTVPPGSSEDRGFTPYPTETPNTSGDSTPLTLPPHRPTNSPTANSHTRPSHPSSPTQHFRTPFPPAPPKNPQSSSSPSSSYCSQRSRLVCSHPIGLLLALMLGILLCVWRFRAHKRREDLARGEYRAVAAHITDNAFDNTFADDYSYNDDDDGDEYDSEEDEFGWSGGKRRVIEMKKLGDDEHSGLSME